MLIGGAIFVFYSLAADPVPDDPPDEVVVTTERASQIADRFRGVWMRPPEPTELGALIEEYVREEILVREALDLSMDRDDAVIRQRLAQKMQFLLESAAGSAVPTDQDLQAHFDENAADYESGARIAFEQVFLGEAPPDAGIEAALASLRAGADPQSAGRRTLLPGAMPMTGGRPVDATFGTGFVARLKELETGVWSGPVASGYGQHLVRVTERVPGGMPDLADVREQVEADWRRQRTAELVAAQYARMAEGYAIVRPDETELSGIVR
jgi:hypothetical protein